VRYPELPILFLETRPLAEEWTFRYLGAALAEAIAEAGHAAPPHRRAAEAPTDYIAAPADAAPDSPAKRSRRRRSTPSA
jgi:hypothetical protein